MSFYSYKNANSTRCPCSVSGNDVLKGLNEKVCIQVQRVYDSCLQQEHAISRIQSPVLSHRHEAIRPTRHYWDHCRRGLRCVW